MNSLLMVIISFAAFGLAYVFYGTFISRKLFGVNPDRKTPAHEKSDGIDYVPTRKFILFGHHFVSIAGVTPMVGPAIAIIWGWMPALLWVVFGSIFIGGVHDFGSLLISVRREGRSIGDITGSLISPGTRFVMLMIFFFLLLVVIALFAFIIADLLVRFPASVLTIWIQVPIAIFFGWIIYKKKWNLILWSLISLVVLLSSFWGSYSLEIHTGFIADITARAGPYALGIWIIVLLVYVFFASTLPVHRLLQPRDYINSYLLYVSMAAILLGVVFAHPNMAAPALSDSVPKGTPPLLPLLFVTIACGAVSGFHSLVSSGTSSKQINNEKDALFIGYGAMILEAIVGVLAIAAVAAGLGAEKLKETFASYGGSTMGTNAFIQGGGQLIMQFASHVGLGSIITIGIAEVFISIVIICFAGTTLDTATRIQRYVITEIGSTFKAKAFENRYVATTIAVGTAAMLAFSHGWQSQTANYLWQVFGTINQLLAAMILLIVTVYLKKTGKNIAYTFIPMLFLLVITAWAMIWKITSMLRGFKTENIILIVIGVSALILESFVVIFGAKTLFKKEASEK